jgi:hypothetical protein
MSEELIGTPDEILKKLEQAEDLFDKLEKLEIPDGVKDKAKEKWAVKLDALAIKGSESSYDEKEQDYDATRVMRYIDALYLLGELEDAIVWVNTATPFALAGDALLAELETADKILEGIYQFTSEVLKLFKKGFSWSQVLTILWNALTRFIIVWTVNTMKANTQMNLALVKTYIVKARAKAFPQSFTGRRLRKKRSRFRLDPKPIETPKVKRSIFGRKKKAKAEKVVEKPKPKAKRGRKPRVPREDVPKP